MQRYKHIWFAMLLICFKAMGQTDDRINFPVDGSVFQQDGSGNALIKISGQVKKNKTFYFSIKKCTGDFTFSSIGADQRTISTGNTAPDGSRLYFIDQSAGQSIILPKGFYRLTLFYKNAFNVKQICDTKDFGVGDVYFIGGQSNAAGWGGPNMTGFSGGIDYNVISGSGDNTVSTTGSSEDSPMVRVYANREHENGSTIGVEGTQRIAKYGLPYKNNIFGTPSLQVSSGFSTFKNGSTNNPDANRIPMYPNGYNSWCWAPLGYKFATNNGTVNKYAGTPTIWFNAAAAGTSMVDQPISMAPLNYNAWGRNYFHPNSLAVKLSATIQNYSCALGAKAVLWCQGENDTYGLKASDPTGDAVFLSNYQTVLNRIIEFSREAATGNANNSDLNWFVAKTTASPDIGNGSNGYQFLNQILINNSASIKSDTIRSLQFNNPANKIYAGPDTDLLIGPNQRSNGSNVHISGLALNDLAQVWYNKITSAAGTSHVKPSPLLKLNNVSFSNGSYILEVDNAIGATRFFW